MLVGVRLFVLVEVLESHFRFLGKRQEPHRVFQRAAARLGQNDIPRKAAPLEKSDTQLALQSFDMHGYGGLAIAQLDRRAREVTGEGDYTEGGEPLEEITVCSCPKTRLGT